VKVTKRQLKQIIKEEAEEVLSEAYSEERYDRGNLSNPLENPGVYYSQLKADSEDPSSYYGGEDNRPEGAKAVNQIAQLMHKLSWETGQAKKLPQLIDDTNNLIQQAKSMEGRPREEADVAEQVLAQFLKDMPQF